jgi:hypothetical protein
LKIVSDDAVNLLEVDFLKSTDLPFPNDPGFSRRDFRVKMRVGPFFSLTMPLGDSYRFRYTGKSPVDTIKSLQNPCGKDKFMSNNKLAHNPKKGSPRSFTSSPRINELALSQYLSFLISWIGFLHDPPPMSFLALKIQEFLFRLMITLRNF